MLNMRNLCRLCGASGVNIGLGVSLVDDAYKYLAEEITISFNIEINENNGFPLKLCPICFKIVGDFVSLKEKRHVYHKYFCQLLKVPETSGILQTTNAAISQTPTTCFYQPLRCVVPDINVIAQIASAMVENTIDAISETPLTCSYEPLNHSVLETNVVTETTSSVTSETDDIKCEIESDSEEECSPAYEPLEVSPSISADDVQKVLNSELLSVNVKDKNKIITKELRVVLKKIDVQKYMSDVANVKKKQNMTGKQKETPNIKYNLKRVLKSPVTVKNNQNVKEISKSKQKETLFPLKSVTKTQSDVTSVTKICNFCNQKIYSQYFKTHMEAHKKLINSTASKDIPKFTCKKCKLTFLTKISLTKHEYVHKKNKLHCLHCSKIFFSRFSLQQHVIEHINQHRLKCTICDDTFYDSFNLHHHEYNTHRIRYKCYECGKTFNTLQLLTVHSILLHHNKSHKVLKTLISSNRSHINIINTPPTTIEVTTPIAQVFIKTEPCDECASPQFEFVPCKSSTDIKQENDRESEMDYEELPLVIDEAVTNTENCTDDVPTTEKTNNSDNYVSKSSHTIEDNVKNGTENSSTPEITSKVITDNGKSTTTLTKKDNGKSIPENCGDLVKATNTSKDLLEAVNTYTSYPPRCGTKLGVDLFPCNFCTLFDVSTASRLLAHLNGSHRCRHCNLCFKNYRLRSVHETYVHYKKPIFTCERCETSYLDSETLSAHVKGNWCHPSKGEMDVILNGSPPTRFAEFSNQKLLERKSPKRCSTVTSNSEKSPGVTSDVRSFVSMDSGNLTIHIKSNHAGASKKDTHVSFVLPKNVSSVILTQNKQGELASTVDKTSLNTKTNVETEVVTCMPVFSNELSDQPSTSRTNNQLSESALKIKRESYKYICNLCTHFVGYKTPQFFKSHLINEHKLTVKDILKHIPTLTKCKVCKMEFFTKTLLRKHIIHRHRFLFDFDKTKRRFCIKNELRTHKTSPPKPISADCKTLVSEHYKTQHINAESFFCDVCFEKFVSKDDLSSHVITQHFL